jgi:ferritin
MEELTLVSTHQRPLKPLVEAALKNELRLLQAGIQRSQQKLHDFETRYSLSTIDFLRRFESDQLEETLEFAEWVGEHRLLTRLLEKAKVLQEVRFAD